MRPKAKLNETYCFKVSSEEREMINFLRKNWKLPDELRAYIRKLYSMKMSQMRTKTDVDGDVYG